MAELNRWINSHCYSDDGVAELYDIIRNDDTYQYQLENSLECYENGEDVESYPEGFALKGKDDAAFEAACEEEMLSWAANNYEEYTREEALKILVEILVKKFDIDSDIDPEWGISDEVIAEIISRNSNRRAYELINGNFIIENDE